MFYRAVMIHNEHSTEYDVKTCTKDAAFEVESAETVWALAQCCVGGL